MKTPAPTRGIFKLVCLLPCLLLAGFSCLAQTGMTNTVSALPSALPDVGSSVVRVFGALLVVLGIFLGGIWLFRNWQRLAVRRGGAPKLNVLEMKSIGQRQQILVVGYQQQRMLLAASPSGVTLISHLPAADETEVVAPATRTSFAEAFQMVLNRKS